MDTRSPAPPTRGERIWRTVLFVLSAAMAASALFSADAGHFGKAIGDLGASVLMLSLMVQFPFLRAIVKVTAEQDGRSPEQLRKQREALVQQAEKVRAANPWADMAGRAGWVLLALSLLLRIGGAA
jgi:hypothetical protein